MDGTHYPLPAPQVSESGSASTLEWIPLRRRLHETSFRRSSMKVTINPEMCQGHARCVAVAPRTIHLRDEDGHAEVSDVNVPDEELAAVRKAMLNCPERAITLTD